MSRFDYKYYRDTYCGVLDETAFARFSPSACDVVSMLVGRDCEETSDSCVLRALCLETDHLACESEKSRGVSRESLGDYSVSYQSYSDAESGFSVDRCPVSAEVIAALTRAGFLTRWA